MMHETRRPESMEEKVTDKGEIEAIIAGTRP